MLRRKPDGLLVLYDEGRGLSKPEIKMFNPSPKIEQDVNEWMKAQKEVTVHRIDWLPSGGLLGAAISYSHGAATQSLHFEIPGLEAQRKAARERGPIERLAVVLLMGGVFMGIAGLALFTVFYPDTWYGLEGQLIDQSLAVKLTVLLCGLGFLAIAAGIAAVLRSRVK